MERVNILVNDEAAEAAARDVLVAADVLPKERGWAGQAAAATSRFWHIPTNRGWIRDYRPDLRASRCRRNGASSPSRRSRRVALQCLGQVQRLEARRSRLRRNWHAAAKVPAWQPEVQVDGERRRMVLEGGSIDVNGRGT